MKKNLTILHCNDLHNQLYFKVDKQMNLIGGISMLSSYIQHVRQENPATLFTISGDILQEDILGSDYKGMNTIGVINAIHPDAISLGNHELDYGLAHLLVFKECIDASTLNANLHVIQAGRMLFEPSRILEANGVRMLTIGLIP